MGSFQIHEDTENLFHIGCGNQKTMGKGGSHIGSNKFGAERKSLENRKVLGHLTNLQSKCNKLNLKTTSSCQSPSAFYDDSTRDNYNNENIHNSKKYADKFLDNACSYIPKYSENMLTTIIETPKCDNDTIEVMSVDYSSIKSNRDYIIQQYDSRLDKFTKQLYRKDIHMYLLEAERRHRPQPLYMSKQAELSDSMRCILVDWLVSISDEYTFTPETLHLAVSYIDRFLSRMSVVRSKLQLVGVAAMMIAAKYEEIYPPDIAEFAFLTNDTYTVKQILRMEQLILRALSFDLTTPTAQTFIDEYASQSDISRDSINMAMYLSELCLVESVHYTRYLPSEIAASSLALSRHTLEEDMWTRELENISGYTLTRLFPIVKQQHKVFEESPNKALQAVRIKFSKESFNKVSSMMPRKLNYED